MFGNPYGYLSTSFTYIFHSTIIILYFVNNSLFLKLLIIIYSCIYRTFQRFIFGINDLYIKPPTNFVIFSEMFFSQVKNNNILLYIS